MESDAAAVVVLGGWESGAGAMLREFDGWWCLRCEGESCWGKRWTGVCVCVCVYVSVNK